MHVGRDPAFSAKWLFILFFGAIKLFFYPTRHSVTINTLVALTILFSVFTFSYSPTPRFVPQNNHTNTKLTQISIHDLPPSGGKIKSPPPSLAL